MPARNRTGERTRAAYSSLERQTDHLALDYYIGRTVLGSEDLVSNLGKAVGMESVVQHKGRLVMPYIYRHILSGIPNAQRVIDSILRILDYRSDLQPLELNLGYPRINTDPDTSGSVIYSVVEDARTQVIVTVEARSVRKRLAEFMDIDGGPKVAPYVRFIDSPDPGVVARAFEIIQATDLSAAMLGLPQLCTAEPKALKPDAIHE